MNGTKKGVSKTREYLAYLRYHYSFQYNTVFPHTRIDIVIPLKH